MCADAAARAFLRVDYCKVIDDLNSIYRAVFLTYLTCGAAYFTNTFHNFHRVI